MSNETNQQPQADVKTFTQEQVNEIVSARLNEDRQKREPPKPDPMAEREADLARREFALSAREVLAEKKLPVELLDALNAPDMDTLNRSIALLGEHTDIFNPNPMLSLPPSGNTDMRGGTDYVRLAMGLQNP